LYYIQPINPLRPCAGGTDDARNKQKVNIMRVRHWPHFVPTISLILSIPAALLGQTDGIAVVRHAPTLNGSVIGSVQQISAESVTLNGSASVHGDLLVPGTPVLKVNEKSIFGGTIIGTGASAPGNYTVTLNGNSQLGYLRTRTDPVSMASVAAPPSPTGTRDVSLNKSSEPVGDFSSVRNLTLNGNVGQIALPGGVYGDLTANGNSGFTIGVPGSAQPTSYAFQRLVLNGNAVLRVVGPVVLTLANGVSINGNIGAPTNPAWLVLNVASGDVTINGGVSLYGYVIAPTGAVAINGNSQLVGGVTADRLVLNGNSTLRLIDSPPVVTLIAPTDGTVVTAPASAVTLQATASDIDGVIKKVEFYAGTTLVGTATAAPFQATWSAVPAGSYALTAKATDNAGATTDSSAENLIVDEPPTVAITQPVDHAVYATGATLTLAATARDSDGFVSKVEFFNGAAKIGEASVAPYQLSLANIPAGTYAFTARATDNYGIPGFSPVFTVTVETPPTAVISAPAIDAAGTGVTLTATAADSDGSIAKVEFYRNDKLIATATAPTSGASTYVYTDSENLPPGRYTYIARSYDNLGLFTDSSVTVVTILATLPYIADFESSEGYTLGPLAGQLGWSADSSAAVIASDLAFNGSWSLALYPATPPVSVTQTFAPYSGHPIVYMDFFARPVAETNIASSTTFTIEGAQFAFVRVNSSAMLEVFNGDGIGGGAWQDTPFAATPGPDNQLTDWARFTARLDWAHRTWDLFADGRMVAADVHFRDNSATYLSTFSVRGDSSATTRVDYNFAGADNPLFTDTNNNGIADQWETMFGFSLAAENRNADPDGDGRTNIQEYVAGTDPTDFYNGAAPTLTTDVPNSGILGSNGLITLHVTGANGAALANAPVVFSITSTTGGQISTDSNGAGASGQLAARTDSQGNATVYVAFGAANSVTISATPQGGGNFAPLSVTVHPLAPDPYKGQIPVVTAPSGNDQEVVGNGRTAAPLVLAVADASGQPLANVPVTFSTSDGAPWLFLVSSSTAAPAASFTLKTNIYGEVADIGAIAVSPAGTTQHILVTAGPVTSDLTIKVVNVLTPAPPLDVTAVENTNGTVTFSWFGRPSGIDDIDLQMQDATGAWVTLQRLPVALWPTPDPVTHRYAVTLAKP
jgi:cytoskeletal protein CcmA (bactofilin family)